MSVGDLLVYLINFAGGLAVFLFGMKLMSEGLQKLAGNKMRNILGKITNNPLRGILTGTLVTTAIQSSSATTVMVVGFVNAGLITLTGAVAVIMGANIGTTVTAWIITLFGLGESGAAFSFPMLLGAVALLFFFSKKDKLQTISEFIMGLALLLVGMEMLQYALPNLQEYPQLLSVLANISGMKFLSIIIFILIGALLTCVVQSSSAMMAITLVLCYKGWIGFDMAVALVMGQNIGTTITANLAAMVANVKGKRAACAHFVFNLIGVVFTLIVFRPVLNVVASVTLSVYGYSPYAHVGDAAYNPEAIPFALSIFHTFFNVVTTCILAFFIPQIINLVNLIVRPSHEEPDDDLRLAYISGSWLSTDELNIESARREIELFSERVLKMYRFLSVLRTTKSEDEFDGVVKRIKKYEEITDNMEREICKYLTKVSAGDLSMEGSQQINSMLRIVDNLECIGDTIYRLAMSCKNKRDSDIHLDRELNENIEHMNDLVSQALEVMNLNLHTDYNHIDIENAYAAERNINNYRDMLRGRHVDALKLGVYDFEMGNAYSVLYALYEKLGDYVINVSEAISKNENASDHD